MKRDCYLGVALDSQTTGTQTTNERDSVDGDRHSQVRWRFVRGHDKPRLMGVAPFHQKLNTRFFRVTFLGCLSDPFKGENVTSN